MQADPEVRLECLPYAFEEQFLGPTGPVTDRSPEAVVDDFWSYGFEKNQVTLRTFLRYSFEQGLSKRLLESFRI